MEIINDKNLLKIISIKIKKTIIKNKRPIKNAKEKKEPKKA